jgi:hypothetical protein
MVCGHSTKIYGPLSSSTPTDSRDRGLGVEQALYRGITDHLAGLSAKLCCQRRTRHVFGIAKLRGEDRREGGVRMSTYREQQKEMVGVPN